MSSIDTSEPVRTAKSPSVIVALWLFALALGGGFSAIFIPAVATLAVIVALVAVGICVLSLREDL